MKYRVLVIVLLILALSVGTAMAAKPIIKADRTYFDVSTGLYMLNGNVYVEVGNRIIKAKQARVSIATLEVWASGGIDLTQGDINFTGDSVYVYGTQSKAQISGGALFKRSNLSISADNVEFNWDTKIAVFNGAVKTTQNDMVTVSDQVRYHVVNNQFL